MSRFADSLKYLKGFYCRRIGKLYPMHLLCLLLCAFFWYKDVLTDPLTWLRSLLLIQCWSDVPQVVFGGNPVAWFISTLVLFYLSFPLMARWVAKARRSFFTATLLCAIVWYLTVYAYGKQMGYLKIMAFPPVRLIDGAIGICLWCLFVRLRKSGIRKRISQLSFAGKSLIELGFSGALIIMCKTCPVVDYYLLEGPFWWLWVAALILICALTTLDSDGGIVCRILTVKPLLWVGSISYAVYMLQYPAISITGIIGKRLGLAEHGLMAYGLYFLLLLALSWLAARYIQKPAANLLRTKIR